MQHQAGSAVVDVKRWIQNSSDWGAHSAACLGMLGGGKEGKEEAGLQQPPVAQSVLVTDVNKQPQLWEEPEASGDSIAKEQPASSVLCQQMEAN